MFVFKTHKATRDVEIFYLLLNLSFAFAFCTVGKLFFTLIIYPSTTDITYACIGSTQADP
jgi:hypothetical protein